MLLRVRPTIRCKTQQLWRS